MGKAGQECGFYVSNQELAAAGAISAAWARNLARILRNYHAPQRGRRETPAGFGTGAGQALAGEARGSNVGGRSTPFLCPNAGFVIMVTGMT